MSVSSLLQRRSSRVRVVADGADRMTLIEHLAALRRALIVSLLAWALGTVIAFFFWGPALHFLVTRSGLQTLYFQAPTGAFTLALKIAIYLGFVIAAPVISQQAWWFVSPGLHQGERRLFLPLLMATMLFFAFGVAFSLFSLPLFLRVLTGFAPANLHYLPFVDDYISFVLVLMVGFGLVFELPVVVYVLGLIRVIDSRRLRRNRFYWFVGLLILCNLATPGVDPVTPLLMFVPLYAMWEGAVLLLRLSDR